MVRTTNGVCSKTSTKGSPFDALRANGQNYGTVIVECSNKCPRDGSISKQAADGKGFGGLINSRDLTTKLAAGKANGKPTTDPPQAEKPAKEEPGKEERSAGRQVGGSAARLVRDGLKNSITQRLYNSKTGRATGS